MFGVNFLENMIHHQTSSSPWNKNYTYAWVDLLGVSVNLNLHIFEPQDLRLYNLISDKKLRRIDDVQALGMLHR